MLSDDFFLFLLNSKFGVGVFPDVQIFQIDELLQSNNQLDNSIHE